MENAVGALKVAFGMMIFVLALSMSISCFSSANHAVQAIVLARDNQTEYTYVKQTAEGVRIVGSETVISTMYRAYKENIEIHFLNSDGSKFGLYYKTDNETYQLKTDSSGQPIPINYIDLSRESLGNEKIANEHLDVILGYGTDNYINLTADLQNKYKNQFIHPNGIYAAIKNFRFKEELGEYYQGEGASKIKKRVITYTIVQEST